MARHDLDLSMIQINQAQLHNTGDVLDPNYEGLSFARWEQQGTCAAFPGRRVSRCPSVARTSSSPPGAARAKDSPLPQRKRRGG